VLFNAAHFQAKEKVMNSIPPVFRVLGIATLLLALGAFATPASQAQIAAPAAGTAQNSFCGNQPLCYEANDFAATITDFRTSTQGGYKVIDVIVRFQNKINQPLALGYLAGSGTALDDRGNRYIVYGGNGFRGIGQVYGNNFDSKFSLRPGGYGDAQFELMWAPGQTVYGLTFELNLTVDEIQTVEGNQHTLGGEFPLHFRGLSNGVTGGAPGQATSFASQGQGGASSIPGLPPCGTTATLANAANSSGAQVPANANTAVSNASTAFSNLGSLFKKKAAATAPPATTTTASAAPCAPANTATGTTSGTAMTSAGSSMSATNGTTTPSTGAATSNAAVPVAKAATTRNATAASTATPTTAKPVAVVAKAPAAQTNATVKKPVPPPAPQKPASTTTTTNQ
jgi:hypothetical protein